MGTGPGLAGRPGPHHRIRWSLLLIPLVLLLGLFAAAGSAIADEGADPTAPSGAAVLTLFHGEGCPHCAAEQEFLAGLAERVPQVEIRLYEVWYDDANRDLLRRTADAMGFEPSGVPVTIVGDRVWIGFSDAMGAEIEAAVVAEVARSAPSPSPSTQAATPGPTPSPTPGDTATEPAPPSGETVDVPLLGEVDVEDSSLLAATLAIGFVDGVNPCSLWVLSVLLAVVLHGGSRARVLLVGSTFLVITAGMYGLYMVGMYSALDYVAGIGWIQAAVGALAIGLGVIQLYDAIAPGRGPSLSINPQRRPGLLRRMRAIAGTHDGIAAAMAGTAALAIGVSLLETPCTAGLPLLWTSLLADQGISTAQAAALFAAYLAVFLLDEIAVFVAAVVTMRATRLQQRHGRALKGVAGSVLVTLGVTMLVAPQAMASMSGTLIVFGAAALVALAVWAIVRWSPPAPTRRRET